MKLVTRCLYGERQRLKRGKFRRKTLRLIRFIILIVHDINIRPGSPKPRSRLLPST